MKSTLDNLHNEDEGGGPTKIHSDLQGQQPQRPGQIGESTSPSIRQQVTSVIMNMKNKLTSQNIVQQQQQHHHHHHHLSHQYYPHDDEDDTDEDDDDDDDDEHYEQAVDIFVKHLDQQELERDRQRRASLPTDDIEMTTLSGVVMRRKQQLQLSYQQQQQQQQHQSQSHQQQEQDHQELPQRAPQQITANQHQQEQHHLLPPKARPLSISSISSAASSGSSSSSNSSSSSGIQSSLTRNSSLNYSQEFRKHSYLASIESLDSSPLITASSSTNCVNADCGPQCPNSANSSDTSSSNKCAIQPIEAALKGLDLSNQLKDLATTRAAVLAAGESQRRSFGTPGNRVSRINRSLHASLRYDKNTAYRIHLMANARALINSQNGNNASGQQLVSASTTTTTETDGTQAFHRHSSISRNNSSTSSDSGHPRQSYLDSCRSLRSFRCTCQSSGAAGQTGAAESTPSSSITSCTSSASLSSQSTPKTSQDDFQSSAMNTQETFKQKAATLDSATCQRTPTTTAPLTQFHHPDCLYLKRPRRASAKLQQSPSSVSSHSNSSSLFRDDGFEDDLTSTASEHSSTVYHHHDNHHHHHHQQHNHSQHHHRQLFYHQNQNHHLNYHQGGHHHEAGLGHLTISQRVITEIIETERSYVDDLEQIVSGYLCYLRDVLDKHKELFSNLEDIHKFNKDFLFQLEECYLNPGAVAACFVENSPKFDVYTHYCTMYPEVVSTLTQLMADPTTAQVLKERQLELNQSLPLGAYLLKPVQRILKYHILFKSLITHTADDATVIEKDRKLINEAFSVMTNIACHINEMKKKHEHSIRVQELQGLLCGWEGPDLTTLGELILEDTFKLYNRQKSARHLLLFDNVLLITKKKRDGSLCYKGHIACSNLMLIETIEGQPLVFNTVPFDNPKALCAFQADNLDKKRDWCLQMKEVIIKSFEVKIPVHVRDLLMSLTKINATDLNSSIKSNASDSSSKAIHAPKYLEKKRNKQDKKK